MNLPIVISVQELSTNHSSGVKLVDVRPLDDYNAGHLPGALNVLPAMLNRSEDGMNGLLPDPAGVNLLASAIGLQNDDHVVIYDQGRTTMAARLLWVLHAYGFNKVSWLNGGLPAWERNNGPISTDAVAPESSNIKLTFTPGNMLSADELMQQINDDNLRILDVRTDGEYAGTDVRSARGGRMPNAKHWEWTTLIDEKGELKSDDALRKQLASFDVTPDNHVTVYCQTHQRSAVMYVVLKHLQYQNVTALDGAWSNWGNRKDTPIENETAKPA